MHAGLDAETLRVIRFPDERVIASCARLIAGEAYTPTVPWGQQRRSRPVQLARTQSAIILPEALATFNRGRAATLHQWLLPISGGFDGAQRRL
jgi:hypothetical protein